MATPFDINDGAKRLEEAAKNNDGLTVARIMEEAGSCNWNKLVTSASEIGKHEQQDPFVLTLNDFLAQDTDRVTVLKVGALKNSFGMQFDNRVFPLASLTDQRCELKK